MLRLTFFCQNATLFENLTGMKKTTVKTKFERANIIAIVVRTR